MRRIKILFTMLLAFTMLPLSLHATYLGGKIIKVGESVTLERVYQHIFGNWTRVNWVTEYNSDNCVQITTNNYDYCVIKGLKKTSYAVKVVCRMYYNGDITEDYYNITVVDNLVTDISLNTYSKEIKPNESFQLTATVSPSNATNKSVTWESDNEDVATVSSTGLVKGKSLGTARITCKATDGSGVKTSCTIRVNNGRFTLKTTEGAELTYEITDESAKTCEVDYSSIPSTVTKVTIPSSANGYRVTAIGDHAFDYRDIESVTMPNTITSIGVYAFYGCHKLKSIEIPKSVKSIGEYAFASCGAMTAVYITDMTAWCKIQFYNWSSNPFYYAHNLYLNGKLVTELVIPDGMTSIENYAFSDCTSITSVTIPNSVTNIGEYAFASCENIRSVTIPNSVTSIRGNAFSFCKGLTSVTIPNSVTSIGGHAFYECKGLTSIEIPNSVTSIGDLAFFNCDGLTSVSIPRNVVEIGINPFWHVDIKVMKVDPENPVYDSREDCNAIIETATDKLVCGCRFTKIPKSIKTIGKYSFGYFEEPVFNSLILPSNIEKLEEIRIKNLEVLTIGKGVKSMDTPLCYYAPKVINSLIEYPNNDTICNSDETYSKVEVVYVPKGTKSRYLASTSWSKFPNIVEANFVTDVTFANSSIQIAQGKSMQLTANITPADADNKELEWESSDEDVVMVTPTGKIVAMGVGTAYVYATAMDCGSTYGTCKVTVTDPTLITDITFDTTAATLSPGESLQLIPTITPANAKNQELEWTSSNEDVAMVTSNGKVVAMGKGTAVITATAKDGTGVSASCQITVTQKVKSISLNHTTYSLDIGESVTLEAIVKPDNAEDKSVTWTSSDENILVVNKNGRVVCLEYGTATITATTNDGSNLSASCVFNCVPVGIEDAKQDGKKSVIHSVSGARRTTTRKGINIINGKKVLVK